MQYPRSRPYMIILTRATPHPGQHTHKVGWSTDINSKWDVNESMIIANKVSHTHLLTSDCIIDILQQKLVKSRQHNLNNIDIITHYFSKYQSDIKQAISQWATQHPNNINVLHSIHQNLKSISDQSKT